MTELKNVDSLTLQLLAEFKSISWETPGLRSVETLNCALGTHIGLRRPRNEDRVLIAQVDCAYGETFTVAAVCDGVGGSEKGDEAATIALVSLVAQLAKLRIHVPIPKLITQLLKGMDEAVRDALGGRGTTTASVWLSSSGGEVAAINVGDSRIFKWSPGKELTQVSIDDTIENELKELNIKDPSVLDARGLRGSLSQALGQSGRSSKELSLKVIHHEVFADSGIIIASDGAWKGSKGGFAAIAKNTTSPIDLVRRALTLANWCGGVDNASIVAISAANALPSIRPRIRSDASMTIVTAWISDTKIIVYDSINQPELAESRGEKIATALPKVRKAKESKKRVRKKTNKSEDQNKQLNLPEDNLFKQSMVRPVVQVSSDDDSSNQG